MSLPRELRKRTRSPSIALITRTPSHLISYAHPVSSVGSVPVTAFIGCNESRSSTPHSRTVRVTPHTDETDACRECPGHDHRKGLRCMKSVTSTPNRSHSSCRYERRTYWARGDALGRGGSSAE